MASALETELCSLLGIRYPILQTAMGWIATPELVAASSNAGAMGFLATANLRPDEVDREIVRVKQLTDRPFGVNLLMEAPGVTLVAVFTPEHGLTGKMEHGAPVPDRPQRPRALRTRLAIRILQLLHQRIHAARIRLRRLPQRARNLR